MPEPIRPLDDLAAEAKEVPMLPAHEIRRRGDRRRTVRRVTTTLAVAAVAAGVGTGVWAVAPYMDGLRGPQWADTAVPSPAPTSEESPDAGPSVEPTPSPSPTASPVVPPTWANVPTVQLMYPYDSSVAQEVTEYEHIGLAAKGLCDPGDLGDPDTVLVREFGVDGATYEYAIVLGYSSVQAATAGYDAISDAARDCSDLIRKAGYDRATAQELPAPPFDADSLDRQPARAGYFMSMAVHEGEDLGVFNDTMVVQAGERVAWLVTTFEGMDNNCTSVPGEDAMQCEFAKSLPEIADLLDS